MLKFFKNGEKHWGSADNDAVLRLLVLINTELFGLPERPRLLEEIALRLINRIRSSRQTKPKIVLPDHPDKLLKKIGELAFFGFSEVAKARETDYGYIVIWEQLQTRNLPDMIRDFLVAKFVTLSDSEYAYGSPELADLVNGGPKKW